jgi:hypothetical protein
MLLLGLLWTGYFYPVSSYAQLADSLLIRCLSHERDVIRGRGNPDYQTDRLRTEEAIQQYLKTNRSQLRTAATNDIIRIPVVVHVIYGGAEGVVGGADNANISDEQIRSQIAILNEDYRRKPGTLGFNADPAGVDTGIEFYLAEYDDHGKSTTGITRTRYTERTIFNPLTDDDLIADIIAWPTDKYLNIWTCRFVGSYLGISQFPSIDGVDGLSTKNEIYAKTDGVIIDFRYFGRNAAANTSRIYNLGRTVTHEVGHWLGLLHTWGDAVCGDDFCDDTPRAEGSNQSSVCTDKYSTCSGTRTRNMIENYMDYSADSCMNIFTGDQLARMRTVLTMSPRRLRLVELAKIGRLDPAEKLTVDVFPNPASTEVKATVRFADYQSFSVTVYDQMGNALQASNYVDVWSRTVSLDINKFNTGLYFFKVTTGKETVTKRFVIK